MVVFSGGKGLRGPQSSGLVVGKAKLIEAARMNGSPASSVGRGMKVGKEELMGLLAAVELFLDGRIDGVRATVDDGDELFFPGGVPRVRIELLGERTADAYGAPLRDGEPSIFMGGWDGGMFADPMTLQPGEAQQVARRLRELLVDPVALGDEDVEMVEGLLRTLNLSNGIAIVINSPGGSGLAAERMINLLRSYSGTGEYWAIVPGKAKSAATMVCLGASKILMGPASELGPVDPQQLVRGKFVSVHHIIDSYHKLFRGAVKAKGNLEPYLQQLSNYDAREIVSLETETRI
ncbi:Uncharacterized protein mlr3804 [Geodia barretti]|uniref:Uncharacterized protein mlr3804 n=1 Tax=Geodia barretti TaxID=519541 RepID=A0AA35WHM9_GEOBA|nr:Uncharacterized protein mlr3804 [Geodia barretti]